MPVNAYIVESRGSAPFDWQQRYISTFIDAMRAADWSDRDAAKEAIIEPVAAQLGLLAPPAALS
ncbi:MAG: hypothetical protein JO372_21555 [Solirubrobacterales bacterium]|nr:hypothetical protein [Solirubrobacterales bacterium]